MRVHGRSQRLRRQTAWSLLAVTALFGAVLAAWVTGPASAATGFANPAFQTQWQAGEAITPNFWGPLQFARDGQNEPYVEGKLTDGTSGQRLVQYFDKGRMELTDPAAGTVTSGLLATELISGKLQAGNSNFQTLQPAAVPVAGDPDNIGPTYASISANAATLQSAATSALGAPTTRLLGPTGTLGTYTGAYASDSQANIATYDATTQHNVPAAFLNFRNKVNLLNIGFAISEPFWSNVKVGGAQKDVLVQAFERRVLTYTPTNNDPFKVEFGNIGQHYYAWRQSPQTQPTATPVFTATPTAVVDTIVPTLSEVTQVYRTPYSFAVTWKTDETASSEVLYGATTNYETINDKQRKVFEVEHLVVVSGLTPGATYHYRAQSHDTSGNMGKESDDHTVTLPAVADVPVFSGITVTKTTATTFTVSWTTNNNSYARIEYATNGVYDRARPGDADNPLGLSHAATAISCESNTAYRFRVVSILPNGTASASDDINVGFTSNTATTTAESAGVKINDITATQEKAGKATRITFSTSRPASIIIEIGPTNKLGGGSLFGATDLYKYPLSRTLHSIDVNLPPGVTYYRIAVYDEQGTGTSDIRTVTVA